jgi:hypothetical protein
MGSTCSEGHPFGAAPYPRNWPFDGAGQGSARKAHGERTHDERRR